MVGFFGNYEKAEYAITWNIGDIYENGYYPFAIIEKLEEGTYPIPLEETWFKWYDDVGYVVIDKPKYEDMIKNIVDKI